MLVMPTLIKPVLHNKTIVRMPNKTHKGIFLDTMLRKGTSYNGIKTCKSLVKKPKNQNRQLVLGSGFKNGTVL